MQAIWWEDFPEVLRREHFRVLGITLCGPAPIGTVHLAWEPGLTVLYGVNGAGKTAVLDGITRVLRGRAAEGGSGFLHVELIDPNEPLDWREKYFSTELVAAIATEVRNQVFDPNLGIFFFWDFDEDRWSEFEKLMSTSTAAEAARQSLAMVAGVQDAEFGPVAAELAPQGLFSLLAAGTEEPSYRIFVSGRPSEDTPALDRQLTSLREYLDDRASRKVVSVSELQTWRTTESRPFLDDERPAWVPVPLVEMGKLEKAVASVFVGELGDPDHLTHRALLEWNRESPLFEDTRPRPPDEGEPSDVTGPHPGTVPGLWIGVYRIGDPPTLGELASRLSERANAILKDLLIDPPLLALKPLERQHWVEGRVAEWEALDGPSNTMVPLRALSKAQGRWASIAIQLALDGTRPDVLVIGPEQKPWSPAFPGAAVIDEPEQALHSRAIDHLLEGLASLAARSGSPVFVASHSPAFLHHRVAKLIHVNRAEASAKLVPLPNPLVSSLESVAEDLGLRASDLLQLTSVFLIVEGERDKVVLGETIGDELKNLRAQIVPMRGTRNLSSVIDSQFVFDYTTASVIVCLDRLRTDRVGEVWREARELLDTDGGRAALRRIDAAAREEAGSPEEREAFEFGRRALVSRQHDRIRFFGFPEPDIIYYLPVRAFLSNAESWAVVESEYKDTRERGEKMEKMYEWLRRVHGVNTSVKAFQKAARQLDRLPGEFTELLELVKELASRRSRLDVSAG